MPLKYILQSWAKINNIFKQDKGIARYGGVVWKRLPASYARRKVYFTPTAGNLFYYSSYKMKYINDENSLSGNNSNGRNEVKTVFSERGIMQLEWMVYWFWEKFTGTPITDRLMKMLEVYAKVNPQEQHKTTADMVEIVSIIIQLCEQLNEIIEFETVQDWEDEVEGWVKPVLEVTNK